MVAVRRHTRLSVHTRYRLDHQAAEEELDLAAAGEAQGRARGRHEIRSRRIAKCHRSGVRRRGPTATVRTVSAGFVDVDRPRVQLQGVHLNAGKAVEARNARASVDIPAVGAALDLAARAHVRTRGHAAPPRVGLAAGAAALRRLRSVDAVEGCRDPLPVREMTSCPKVLIGAGGSADAFAVSLRPDRARAVRPGNSLCGKPSGSTPKRKQERPAQ